MLHLLAEDCIQFTVEQHLNNLFSRRRPSGGIDELSHMGVLEGHPVVDCSANELSGLESTDLNGGSDE